MADGKYAIVFIKPMLSGRALLSLQLRRMVLQMLLNRKGNGKGKRNRRSVCFNPKCFVA